MEAIPKGQFNYKLNDLHGGYSSPHIVGSSANESEAITSFSIPKPSDMSSFGNLENGIFIIGGISYDVKDTWMGRADGSPLDDEDGDGAIYYFVKIAGYLPNVPGDSGFRLYDDDDAGLAGDPLPRTDLVNEQMKSYYRPAFIDVVDAAKEDPTKDHNPHKHVPFRTNEFVHGLFTVADDAVDLTDRRELWTCPLVACYQGGQGSDIDPNDSAGDNEGALLGETNDVFPNSQFSVVFVETCRDQGVVESTDKELLITGTSAHEMGHQPGTGTADDDHAELGIMTAGLAVDLTGRYAAAFKPASILRFRKSKKWAE